MNIQNRINKLESQAHDDIDFMSLEQLQQKIYEIFKLDIPEMTIDHVPIILDAWRGDNMPEELRL